MLAVVLATRCVAGVPSALGLLAADEVDPLLLSPNVRAALFASSPARLVPDKKCANAAGDAVWCTDDKASKVSNATTPSDSRNASRALRRVDAKTPPKNCVDASGDSVYCQDTKAVNASKFHGQAIKPGMDPQGCSAVEGGSATDGWCHENCGDATPNCPPALCACSSAKVMAERKVKASALPLGGDPSTCKTASAEAASTDEWCVQNCGDENPLCPPDMCVCSQTAKLPVLAKEQEAEAPEAPVEGAVAWDPTTVPQAPVPENPAVPLPSTPAGESDVPPETIVPGHNETAIFPGGDASTCESPQGPAGGTTEWCKNNCAETKMGGPPNCPSDLCVCRNKGDTSKKWPPAKKVKPYDPSTVPTYRPLKGQGNDHQPAKGAQAQPAEEKPAAWAPGRGEQAIFPGGEPTSCTAVEGQTQSNDVWCVNNCDIANWKEQAPECPLNLCQCTKPGDKKKKWDLSPAKAEVVPTAQATAPDVPTWDPSTVPQWEPPEPPKETAADRRGGIASAEDLTNPKIPTAQIPTPDAVAPPIPSAAAKPALKKGGDAKGCVKALGQSMSSDAWCVTNCALPGSAQLCTTDLCTCGAVHTIPQAIHPGGDPKTCSAVEGQMESNDAWCVNNCDVTNWKAQPPECPSSLCKCKDSGDGKKLWEFPEQESPDAPEPIVPWDPSTIPAPYVAKPYDPSTAPTYKPNYHPPAAKPALFPGGDPATCMKVEGSSGTTEWCQTNCAQVPPTNCPADLCACSSKGNPKRHWATATRNEDGTPKLPPAPQGKAGESALKPGMDAAFCVAADGQNMASTGWCIMNCGLPAPQTNCDAQLCYCSDVQRVSAIYPGGDPTTCKGVENAAEDGWCVDNCGDALEKSSNSCPDYLCKCSKPGNKEKAPGTELPKGVKAAPLAFALPKGGDPSSCIALQGKFEDNDPDKPTNEWCVSSCSKKTMEEGDCDVSKCFCADENAILTFGGDDSGGGSATVIDADGPLHGAAGSAAAMVARQGGGSPGGGRSPDSPNGGAGEGEGAGAALRARAVTPVHTAEYMCKEYGVQCKASARELKAVALAAKAAKRREQRFTKRSRAPPRRLEERQKK